MTLVGSDPPSLVSTWIGFKHQAVSPLGIVLHDLLQGIEVQLAQLRKGQLLAEVLMLCSIGMHTAYGSYKVVNANVAILAHRETF